MHSVICTWPGVYWCWWQLCGSCFDYHCILLWSSCVEMFWSHNHKLPMWSESSLWRTETQTKYLLQITDYILVCHSTPYWHYRLLSQSLFKLTSMPHDPICLLVGMALQLKHIIKRKPNKSNLVLYRQLLSLTVIIVFCV